MITLVARQHAIEITQTQDLAQKQYGVVFGAKGDRSGKPRAKP
jgi:hypothetical protein